MNFTTNEWLMQSARKHFNEKYNAVYSVQFVGDKIYRCALHSPDGPIHYAKCTGLKLNSDFAGFVSVDRV